MIYIHRSDGVYVMFEGMTTDQITLMLVDQNMACEFIDEAAYNAQVAGAR